MKLMKILEDESVVETDALYLDGYGFGDRMLEGLVVKLTLNKDRRVVANANWPKGLDPDYWQERAISHAMEQDTFSTSPMLEDDAGFMLPEHGQD